MPVASKVEIPVVSIKPHQDMGRKWEENSKNSALVADERRKYKIKDDAAYGQIVATPAADKYRARVKFTSASGSDRDEEDIHIMHRKKMLRSFKKYQKGLDIAYAEDAKRFKEAIEKKKGNWEDGISTTLRFTGSRARGRQAASVAGRWLTGDPHIAAYMPESVKVDGPPYDIAPERLKATFRASLTQLLTQTGIIIFESEYDPAVMLKHNSRIKEFLSRFSDPVRAINWSIDKLPDKSYCIWFLKSGQLHLGIQIFAP